MSSRRWGRWLRAVLCLGAALACMQACSASPPRQSSTRTAQQGIPLKQTVIPDGVDLFLRMDESGSMYGEGGTDPAGLRYEAAKYLVQNLLVQEADATYPHRISVVHFGDTALARPLIDLIPANAGELGARIAPGTGATPPAPEKGHGSGRAPPHREVKVAKRLG